MINNSTKQSILNKVLKSKEFSNSEIYKNLLHYLVNSSIKKVVPKEYTIAVDVFNKDKSFDPALDTLVRVHIYKLRKKLEKYYNQEGKDEKIRIEIPRGHYGVEFVACAKESDWKKQYKLYIWALSAAIVLCNVFYLLKIYHYQQKSAYLNSLKDDAIWQDFFHKKNSKMVVLGDHFFFVKSPTSRPERTIIRRDDINSVDEYQAYINSNDENVDYRVLAYQLFPKNSIWPFADLYPVLQALNQKYTLKASTTITASDIIDNDIIFLGSFHTLALFKETFKNSNFDFAVYPNSITFKGSGDTTQILQPDDEDPRMYHTDYGLFRKIPGPTKNVIYIFTSFHDTGMIGIIQYFLQKKTLQEIENRCIKKFGSMPQYFEILFKSSGYNRTVYTTEIEDVYEIDSSKEIW